MLRIIAIGLRRFDFALDAGRLMGDRFVEDRTSAKGRSRPLERRPRPAALQRIAALHASLAAMRYSAAAWCSRVNFRDRGQPQTYSRGPEKGSFPPSLRVAYPCSGQIGAAGPERPLAPSSSTVRLPSLAAADTPPRCRGPECRLSDRRDRSRWAAAPCCSGCSPCSSAYRSSRSPCRSSNRLR